MLGVHLVLLKLFTHFPNVIDWKSEDFCVLSFSCKLLARSLQWGRDSVFALLMVLNLLTFPWNGKSEVLGVFAFLASCLQGSRQDSAWWHLPCFIETVLLIFPCFRLEIFKKVTNLEDLGFSCKLLAATAGK